jgi:hypothetical protein
MKQATLLKTIVGAGALCTLLIGADVRAQSEGTRRLFDSEFYKPKAKQISAAKAKPPRRYRLVTPNLVPDRVAPDTVIGITLWRLRPALARDDRQTRLLKHASDKSKIQEWTPERVAVDTPLKVGQRVRLSIEAARTGYLYVIDRELYADGSVGEPMLIFPTKNLRSGNNRVFVGKLTDIPALEDSPPYFTLDPEEQRNTLVGELISVLVTPQPLPDVPIGEGAIKLPKEMVAQWEQAWGTNVGKMELTGTAKNWTPEEKAAAQGKPLAPDAPAPQTIFYRPEAKSDQPVMISIKLRYGNSAPGAR